MDHELLALSVRADFLEIEAERLQTVVQAQRRLLLAWLERFPGADEELIEQTKFATK